jgi:Transcriptional regulator
VNTTRNDILDAASRLFKNKGFLRTSVDEVAHRAGINKATIFYYFPSKEHLLYEVLCEAMRRGIKEMQSITSSSSPQEKLENVIKGHLKFNLHDDNFGGISAFEQKNLSPKLRKSYVPLRDEYEGLIREAVQDAMSTGQIKQGDVEVQTRLILGVLNSVNRWFKQSGTLSIGEVGDEMCQLIFCDRSQLGERSRQR